MTWHQSLIYVPENSDNFYAYSIPWEYWSLRGAYGILNLNRGVLIKVDGWLGQIFHARPFKS